MNIKVYKTSEISEEDWKQIANGFNICFDTQHSVDHLMNFYVSTVFGYSYHAIAYTDDNKVMGYNSFIPTIYQYQGEKLLVGVSGGTFVLKEFRNNIFLFKDLMNALFEYCKSEGMVLKVGVPNKNSFRYTIKIIKSKLVGYLPYYILPVRAFTLLHVKKLNFLNVFSYIYCIVKIWLLDFFSRYIHVKAISRKLQICADKDFYRFRFIDTRKYIKYESRQYVGYYRICDENGVKVAYIMDFREKGERTFRSLLHLVKYIVKHTSKVDAVMFIGTLGFKQPLLLKVPWRLEPKHLPMTVNVLNKESNEVLEKVVEDLKSWEFGLMNFDAR